MALTGVPTIVSMGYQALLFCPDDKTARTVTQVLSELEFTVEACIEPFAAVKKLMGQHFDAVVVDCDNEQNATLLFKSARNSTSNQTSLAVAVVEGQAGVAKAFRIGANLVLTKPINIEQTKGTLRVARGLLRKSDPTKPSPTATGSFAIPAAEAPPAAPTPVPAKPAVPKPAAVKPAASTVAPAKPAATATPKPQVAATKPAAPPAWPAAAASAKPAATAQNVTESRTAEKPASPAPALYNAVLATPAAQKPVAPQIEIKPMVSSAPITAGAASAPAPALEPQPPKREEKAATAPSDLFEKASDPSASEPAPYAGSAPSFSFGGSTAEPDSGGSKKALIGVAAVFIIAIGGYFGWSHLKTTNNSSPQPVASSTPAPASSPAAPKPSAAPLPSTAKETDANPVSQPDVRLKSLDSSEDDEASTERSVNKTPGKSAIVPSTPTKSEIEEKPEAPALVVKGGKVPSVQQKPAAAPDVAAPSLIGMGAPTDALPNLGTSDAGLKPRLQTLSVSQGVSQGLLYKKVAPVYPQNALRMRVEGVVELQATISKTGDITHIKVVSGDPQLTKAATDAVKQWKYKPYLLNGEPVEIQTGVTVNFKMPH